MPSFLHCAINIIKNQNTFYDCIKKTVQNIFLLNKNLPMLPHSRDMRAVNKLIYLLECILVVLDVDIECCP